MNEGASQKAELPPQAAAQASQPGNDRPESAWWTGRAYASPYQNPAFWGLSITQFLGAFNDNLYKQILLLLFVAVPWNGQTRDLQWLATGCFSLPFVLFSGYAGYLSDRYSKRRVIIASKVAEILIMAAGIGGFALWTSMGMNAVTIGLLCVTIFCMGAQSAFFGPGKYGILPEFLPERQLPDANGFILMTTFVAVILGSALAGTLLEWFGQRLWAAGVVCTGIAVLGTLSSLLVARVAAANPALRFERSALVIPGELRQHFRADPTLWGALLVSSVFWMSAAIAQMAVNALGKLQLGVGDQKTSLLVASISIGIAFGSILAARMSRHRFHTRVLMAGLWGLCSCLVLLAIPAANPQRHLLGYGGSIGALIVAGAFTGMFSVPLQVFLQARPPQTLKGRMIASQNLLNWIGITASAPIYHLATVALEKANVPPCGMFLVVAGMLAAAGLYLHIAWLPRLVQPAVR